MKIVGRIGFVIVILLALVGINSVLARFVGTVQFLVDPASVELAANEPPGAGRQRGHDPLGRPHRNGRLGGPVALRRADWSRRCPAARLWF